MGLEDIAFFDLLVNQGQHRMHLVRRITIIGATGAEKDERETWKDWAHLLTERRAILPPETMHRHGERE